MYGNSGTVSALLGELDVIEVIDKNEPEVKSVDWKKIEPRAKGLMVDWVFGGYIFRIREG